MVDIKVTDSERGAAWLIEGFAYFRRSPETWIVIVIITFVINFMLAILPIIGTVVMQILTPVFIGGLLSGCDEIRNGEKLDINHLFSGFKKNFPDLIIVGLIYSFGGVFIIMSMALVAFFTIGLDFFSNIVMYSDINSIVAEIYSGEFLFRILLVVLIGLFLYVPLLMALWFAPALVVLDGQKPIDSLRNSFVGCVKNILPFLIYGVVSLILGILASIPFFLGWLILAPMIIASIYIAYLDIYTSNAQTTITQS